MEEVIFLPWPVQVITPRDTSWELVGVNGGVEKVAEANFAARHANTLVPVKCAELKFMLPCFFAWLYFILKQ